MLTICGVAQCSHCWLFQNEWQPRLHLGARVVQCFQQHYNYRALRPDCKILKMGVYNLCARIKCN